MLILDNVRIFGHGEQILSVVIQDGIISWLGTRDVANTLKLTSNRRIDCEGNWLAPGFVDNHVHLSATGHSLESKDVQAARSNADLHKALFSMEPSEFLMAHGYEDTNWVADIWDFPFPVYVSRIDVHSGVVSAVLAAAIPGIEDLSGWTDRGRISGAAHEKVRAYCLSRSNPLRYIDIAANEFLANGVVAVHEMSGPSVAGIEDAKLVQRFSADADLKVHLWWGELFGYERAANLGAYGCGGDLFIDGSIGSKTAAMSEEYLETGFGNHYVSSEEISQHIRGAITNKLAVGFHAIGDQATHSIAVALKQCESIKDAIRVGDVRVEHAEMIQDEDLEIYRDFGVAFSVQPQFDALWGSPAGMYEQRLGTRYKTLNTFSRYVQNGIPLLLGSDAPVTSINPWLSIKAALNMNQPHQSLSSRAAFRAHTTDGYRRIGNHRPHEIEVGSPADVVLWRIDSLNVVAAPEFASTWSTDVRSGVAPIPNLDNQLPKCLLTISSGKFAYQADGWNL